jgi:hypothetical protein
MPQQLLRDNLCALFFEKVNYFDLAVGLVVTTLGMNLKLLLVFL